ncbi:hypothetical protein TRICHSKD4_1832 [Roseibium sp. TrichSKD4]|nr:hypothetical protein TRICHSKD4_1832 [Roseibium sp. TrichSKD4]
MLADLMQGYGGGPDPWEAMEFLRACAFHDHLRRSNETAPNED